MRWFPPGVKPIIHEAFPAVGRLKSSSHAEPKRLGRILCHPSQDPALGAGVLLAVCSASFWGGLKQSRQYDAALLPTCGNVLPAAIPDRVLLCPPSRSMTSQMVP